MRNRTTQSALLVAGAAAVGVGVAAATWLGKRRLAAVPTRPEPNEHDLAEPPTSGIAESERRATPRPTWAEDASSAAALVGAATPSQERAGEFGIDEASSRTMLRHEPLRRPSFVEPERAELPLGRSADPAIDDALSRRLLPQDETSGAAFLGEEEPFAADSPTDASLDEVWNSLPEAADGEQSEGYDAVAPEDLGSIWLERATQTTREDRPHGSDPTEIPELENLLISEATLGRSRPLDEDDDEDDQDDEIAEDELDDDDEIAEDELDER